MKKAIQKAIEGGWNTLNLTVDQACKVNMGFLVSEALLDSLFWQALGKAMGWRELPVESTHGQEWWRRWHDFIDHLAEGKDAETFFDELLKNARTS